jgi:hypothetical protein
MQIQSNTASNSFFTYTFLDSTGTAVPIKAGDIYSFRVTAINVVGEGQASGVFSAMAATLPTAPGTP